MNDGGQELLTQEEIDALLRAVESSTDDAEATALEPEEEAAITDLLQGLLTAIAPALSVATDPQRATVAQVLRAAEFGERVQGAVLRLQVGSGEDDRFYVALPAGQEPSPQLAQQVATRVGAALRRWNPAAHPVSVQPIVASADEFDRWAEAPWAAVWWDAAGASERIAIAGPLGFLRGLLEGAARGTAEAERERSPAEPPTYPEFADTVTSGARATIDLLYDVPLEVTVVLGRTRLQVREVLELGSGSIVELDKAAGEPVDVLVNGKLVARGEVVVIDEHFGVRISDIVSPVERLQKLR